MVSIFCHKLKPFIQKLNKKSLYQLRLRSHVVDFQIGSRRKSFTMLKLFVIGRPIIYVIIKEVVGAFNRFFRSMIVWLTETKLQTTIDEFEKWSDLPKVHKALDGIRL
jgi:hypothetical protein